MPGEPTGTIVLADTSVLVNLAIVDRLDLLGALAGFDFRVPEEVVEEVRRPEQRELLDRALRAGHLDRSRLSGVPVLDHYRELRHDLGPGEAACLALAYAEGWSVACDEKRFFRREARRLLGEGRLLNTPGLFVLGIRQRYWTVSEADQAKEVLERNRFRMRFRSFDELVRSKGS
jgi:predicted nucleic acid-binding protein